MKHLTKQLWVFFLLMALSTRSSPVEYDPDRDGENKLPKLLKTAELPIEIDQSDLQRQFDALKSMELEQLEYWQLGPVKSLRGRTGIALPADISMRKET